MYQNKALVVARFLYRPSKVVGFYYMSENIHEFLKFTHTTYSCVRDGRELREGGERPTGPGIGDATAQAEQHHHGEDLRRQPEGAQLAGQHRYQGDGDAAQRERGICGRKPIVCRGGSTGWVG
jgi:hypothetical protein